MSKLEAGLGGKKPLVVLAVVFLAVGQLVIAQNLGTNPQFNVAVQGETGAQPEGAFLNFINWVSNVIDRSARGAQSSGPWCRGLRDVALGGGFSRPQPCWPSRV